MISERSPAGHPTTLSGRLGDITPGAQNSYNVLRLSEVGSRTVLDGFTITGGRAVGAGYTRDRGGALYATNATVRIRNCVFVDNTASDAVAALYANFLQHGI